MFTDVGMTALIVEDGGLVSDDELMMNAADCVWLLGVRWLSSQATTSSGYQIEGTEYRPRAVDLTDVLESSSKREWDC